MLHRLFTGRPQGYAQSDEQRDREKRTREAWEALVDRVHRLEIDAKTLRAELEAQNVALVKLRGRITGGIRYSESPREVDQVPTGDRAALRRLAGITPGKPFSHT